MTSVQIRHRALAVAVSFIGTREDPAGSNSGVWVNRFLKEGAGLGPGYPWCAAFLCYCFQKAGYPITFTNRASVGYWDKWIKEYGYLVSRPLKGDVVCYRFDSDDWPDHIGIVERVLAVRWRGKTFVGWIQVIEGNTSLANQADGGRVMRRRRWANRCSFGRVG